MEDSQKIFREAKFVGVEGVEAIIKEIFNIFDYWTEGKIDDKKFVMTFIAQNQTAMKWLKESGKFPDNLAGLAGYLIKEPGAE